MAVALNWTGWKADAGPGLYGQWLVLRRNDAGKHEHFFQNARVYDTDHSDEAKGMAMDEAFEGLLKLFDVNDRQSLTAQRDGMKHDRARARDMEVAAV